MSVARVTKAQARQLGLPGVPRTTPRRKGRNRSTVPAADCAPNVCHTCHLLLARPVDEDRHLAANPTHRRYDSSLTHQARAT